MASTENDDAAVIPPPKNSGQCHLNLLNKNVVSNVMGVEKSVQGAYILSLAKKTKLFRNQKKHRSVDAIYVCDAFTSCLFVCFFLTILSVVEVPLSPQ